MATESATPTVLVLGATGSVGSEVVASLKARREEGDKAFNIRAYVRDEERAAAKLGDGVELVQGSLEEKDKFLAALEGVTQLFLLTVSAPQQPGIEGSIAFAAKEKGVKHIVKLSVYGCSSDAGIDSLFRWHKDSEDRVLAAGVPVTFLRPNLFMQNLIRDDTGSIKSSKTFYRTSDCSISHIDVRDIADVAAVVLTEDGHIGRTYSLTGPDDLTFTQMAELMSSAFGFTVTPTFISDAAHDKAMAGAGLPTNIRRMITTLFQGYRNGAGTKVHGDIEFVTGKPARSLSAFLEEFKDAFCSSEE